MITAAAKSQVSKVRTLRATKEKEKKESLENSA